MFTGSDLQEQGTSLWERTDTEAEERGWSSISLSQASLFFRSKYESSIVCYFIYLGYKGRYLRGLASLRGKNHA